MHECEYHEYSLSLCTPRKHLLIFSKNSTMGPYQNNNLHKNACEYPRLVHHIHTLESNV